MCKSNSSEASCGLGGACKLDICECLDGWRKSNEFRFFDKEELRGNDPLVCDVNDAAIFAVYFFLLLSFLTGILAYALMLKKFSQFKRLLPYFISMLVGVVFCTLKLTNLDLSLTNDPEAAIVYALLYFLNSVVTLIMLGKYVVIQYKTNLLFNSKVSAYMQKVKKFGYFYEFVALVGASLFISVPFISDDHRKDARTIVRIAFFIASLPPLMVSYASVVLSNKLIKLIESLDEASEKENQAKKSVSRVRNIVACSSFLYFMVFFLGSVSSTWLRLEKYFFPLCSGIFATMSLGILFSNKRPRFPKTPFSLTFKRSNNQTNDISNAQL